MMNVDEKVEYWLDIASYDLKTAQSMLRAKRFLYVGFMCHQVIEKALKAYYWDKKREEPEYTHNLIRLCEISGLNEILSENQKQFVDTLMPLNIEARYPKDKRLLLKELNNKKCKEIFKETKEFYKWIVKLLKR
jgi:HEPN domain-containing protein